MLVYFHFAVLFICIFSDVFYISVIIKLRFNSILFVWLPTWRLIKSFFFFLFFIYSRCWIFTIVILCKLQQTNNKNQLKRDMAKEFMVWKLHAAVIILIFEESKFKFYTTLRIFSYLWHFRNVKKDYFDTGDLQQTKSCKENAMWQNLWNFFLLSSPCGKP